MGARRHVYNKYQQSDFTAGQDNLNPIHEDKVRDDRSEEYQEKLAKTLQERLRDREDLEAVVRKKR
jgi:hypothetical protein